MDPDANLKEQRDLRSRLNAGEFKHWRMLDAAQRIIDLTAELDEWLSKGGFLLKAWERLGK